MDPSQRPRERLLDDGPQVLSDAELIAVLLRTGRPGRGAVDTAQDLLAEVGGLVPLARMDVVELIRRPGIGPAKAAALAAALELGHRLTGAELRHGPGLEHPEAVARYLVQRLQGSRREVFGFLALDSRHRLIGCHELTLGTRNQTPVDPAELFRAAVLADAAGLVVFHNHPSGDLDPSRDDLALTRRIVNAGEIIGVKILDHLIVAGARWLSLRQSRPQLFRN
jgi:DNA repair protein RadC